MTHSLTKNQTVIAIDPGYDRLGWAIGTVNKRTVTVLNYGCLQTSSKDTLLQRYRQIQTELLAICQHYQPTVLAIEKLYFARNTTTALKVSEARGLIFACCLPIVADIVEYHPNEIKLAVTGHGQANKAAVAKMTLSQLRLPPAQPVFDQDLANVVSLASAASTTGSPTKSPKLVDDTIDALAILLTHAVSNPAIK